MKTRRVRRRYIVLKLENISNRRQFENTLVDCVLKLYGYKGIIDMTPTIVFYQNSKRIGILTVRHNKITMMLACLTLCSFIKAFGIKVIGITGTLKKAKAMALSAN